MKIQCVFCKKGGLLQEEEKNAHSRVLWRQQLLWREWRNGEIEEESSCLYSSTCDTQRLGKEPRNEENQKQTVKQQNFWKLMAEEKKDYEKVNE